jgi:hypothetical protein
MRAVYQRLQDTSLETRGRRQTEAVGGGFAIIRIDVVVIGVIFLRNVGQGPWFPARRRRGHG